MIGYHSVSAIADAYMKGYNNFDTTKALKAMIHTSKLDEWAKKEYALQGFISSDQEAESVSKTLEYAYMIFVLPKWLKKWDVMTFTGNIQIVALILSIFTTPLRNS